MNVISLKIPDVKLIEPEIFVDDRGFFYESFNQNKFNKYVDISENFVQDNHSKSKKGVLRGLHYQKYPYEQGKLVKVIKGEIFDVAVDIRKKSQTYGKYVHQILSEKNRKQLWIPKGFAHGFLTLSEEAEIIYKTTSFYNENSEITLAYDDPELKIKWPTIKKISLSKKDKKGILFSSFKFKDNIINV